MVLIIRPRGGLTTENGEGFRPLTGIMVLIKIGKQWFLYAKYQFPSPYGDYGSYHDLQCKLFSAL